MGLKLDAEGVLVSDVVIARGPHSHFDSNGHRKVPFSSARRARVAAKRLRMFAYRCADGDHYHLGSTKTRDS